MSAAQVFSAVALVGLGYTGYRAMQARRPKRVLIVLTSHSELGNTGRKTGFWLEELASPYFVFKDAGIEMTLATPKGGKPPLDPKSDEANSKTKNTERFQLDREANAALNSTKKLSEVDEGMFDAIFFPGGHGPVWDLAEDPNSFWLIEKFARARKPIAAVCHGPAVFKKTPSVVKGFNVTCFTNSEEKAVGLEKVVPFLVEDMLKTHGGKFSCGPDWASFVVTDNNSLLITGQNPNSSQSVALALVTKLNG